MLGIATVYFIFVLSFWQGLYCRHDNGPHPHELWEELASSLSQQNECLEDHIKFLEQVGPVNLLS